MAKPIDLGARQDQGQWSKFLPSISGFMTIHLGRDLHVSDHILPERVPSKFEHGIQGIDFLKPEKSYYHYPYALYSAGHAELNLTKCDKRDQLIHSRDKCTTLIGDSGGFQIATGVLKLDWATVKGPEGDKLREQILRWLEYTADWSMTLDVPAFAASPKFQARTGLKNFSDTLDITEHNLHYFMKNRVPGATKFLNVLSGSDPDNSKTWYETVKHFSMPDSVEAMGYEKERTFEGFAFAGVNMRNMYCTLSRLLNLRDDNLLSDKNWIHFLGVGRLDWACYLTSIERSLRRHYNSNINTSFDAASPYVAAGGYALMYNYNKFETNKLTYSMDKGLDDKSLKGTNYQMPFQGPIMERLTTGDLCCMGPTDKNKHGKIGNTSWDSTSYALAMAHNVYNHIQAVQEVNRLADVDYAIRKNVDYKEWYISRSSKKSYTKNQFLPNSIIYFNDFVSKVLDPSNPDPYKMLDENKQFLEFISFGDKTDSTFSEHFGGVPSIEEMASIDIESDLDEKLS